MLKSMTGYGKGEAAAPNGNFLVEIRSVNHRYCEVNLRCPTRYAFLEAELTRHVREKFSRGKLDLFLKEEGLDVQIERFLIGFGEKLHPAAISLRE